MFKKKKKMFKKKKKKKHLPWRNSERGLVSEYLVKGIVTFDFVLGHKSLEISLKFSQPRFLTTKQKLLWIYKNLICELRIKK